QQLILLGLRGEAEGGAGRAAIVPRVVLLDGGVDELTKRAVAGGTGAAPARALGDGGGGVGVLRIARDAGRQRQRVWRRAHDELVRESLEAGDVLPHQGERTWRVGLQLQFPVEHGLPEDEQRIGGGQGGDE